MTFFGACAATGAWMSAAMIIWSVHSRSAAIRVTARTRRMGIYLLLLLGFFAACLVIGVLSHDWLISRIALVSSVVILLPGLASVWARRRLRKPERPLEQP